MITRSLEKEIGELLFKGKAILLIGPRQTGKSTLIKQGEARTAYIKALKAADDHDISLLLDFVRS